MGSSKIAGVAEGQEVRGIPTGDGISAEERVQALFGTSEHASGPEFTVRLILSYCITVPCILPVIYLKRLKFVQGTYLP